MASNNLRIVYTNLADAATLSGTVNASFPLDNLKNDNKGTVCKATGTSLSVSTTVTTVVGTKYAVVFAFTNCTSGSLSVSAGSNISTVPSIAADLFTNSAATGVYAYSYGNAKYLTGYFTATSTSTTITLTGNVTSGIAEASRLIIGPCFIPKYNTEYGLQVGVVDSSKSQRSQAGNLITDNGTVNKTLEFSLPYLTETDRDIWYQIIKLNGTKKSMFVSLFPEDSDAKKEQIYQIYGKLTTVPSITYANPIAYNSSVSIEEV